MLLWCMVTLFLNVTSFYIIVNTMRAIYGKGEMQGDYTTYMRLIDDIRLKLDTIPILFWICLGISVGIVGMVILRWIGWWED